jgi:hypothetical protein
MKIPLDSSIIGVSKGRASCRCLDFLLHKQRFPAELVMPFEPSRFDFRFDIVQFLVLVDLNLFENCL